MRNLITRALCWLVVVFVVACGGASKIVGPDITPTPASSPTPTPEPYAHFVFTADVGECGSPAVPKTAGLAKDRPDATIGIAGDLAYPNGRAVDFKNCLEPWYGIKEIKDRTRPVPGNHEYDQLGALPFFDFYGSLAGPRGLGYYEYYVGSVFVLALNSNRAPMGSSQWNAQLDWMKAIISANPAKCQIAYFHHPLFSAGKYGGNNQSVVFEEILYSAGFDIIINGHDHIYNRRAPQLPNGNIDIVNGTRHFIVGTGGGGLYKCEQEQVASERCLDLYHGILDVKVYWGSNRYTWQFVDTENIVRDSGEGQCH